MLAELFDRVFNRLDKQWKPEITKITDHTGTSRMGYIKPDGQWAALCQTSRPEPTWPSPMVVNSTQSLIDYLRKFSDERSVLCLNTDGILFIQDFSDSPQDPAYRDHRLVFPAQYDADFLGASRTLVRAVGNWVNFDTFENVLDEIGAYTLNYTAIESALQTMEGHESAKVQRTKTSYNIEVSGRVTAAVDIPPSLAINLSFMGEKFNVIFPLRVKVDNKTLQFMLVNSGQLAKAEFEILRSIKARVAEAFPDLLFVEGRL